MMAVKPFSHSYVVELQHSLTHTHTHTAPSCFSHPGSALLTFRHQQDILCIRQEKKTNNPSRSGFFHLWFWIPNVSHSVLLCRWCVIFIHGGVKQRETVHKLINGGWSFLGHILERPRCTAPKIENENLTGAWEGAWRIVLVKTALLLAYDNKEVETCIIGFLWSQWTLFNGISVTRITLPGCE